MRTRLVEVDVGGLERISRHSRSKGDLGREDGCISESRGIFMVIVVDFS